MKFGLERLRLKKEIYLLLIVVLVMHLASYLIIPIFPIILKNDKQLYTTQIGIIIGLGSLAYQVGSMFSALVSDRIGKRLTIFIGALIQTGALFGLGFSQLFYLLFLFQFLNGFGSGMAAPTLKAAIAALTSESSHTRTTAFSLRGISANIGISISGLFLLFYNPDNAKFVFTVAAILFAALALFTILIFPKDCNMDEDCGRIPLKSYVLIFKNRSFVIFSFIVILVNLIYAQLNLLLPLRAEAVLDNRNIVGLIWTIISITVILFQTFISNHYLERYTPLTVIFWSVLFFSGGIFVLGLSHEFYLLTISAIIFTIGQMLLFPIVDTVVGNLADTKLIGAYFSITNILTGIGTAIGAYLGGQIINIYGINTDLMPWTIIACVGLTIAVIIFILKSTNVILKKSKSKT